MWEQIKEAVVNFFSTTGLHILEAIGVLILGIIVIKIIIRILNKIFAKTKMPKVTYKFLLNVLKFGLYMLLIIILCQIVGIPVTGFVAVVSAASLALSLAMQGSLSNLANGVVLISTRPFKEGDYIAIEGVEGTVKEIKLLHTIITTTDNKTISIPNSMVVENELINYSGQKTRKVVFSFSVDYATDIDKAKKIILDIITNCNKVLLDPAPFCALKTLDASSVTLTANCWCLSEHYWDVYYFVMDNVFNEFKREKINIPYNQLEVRLRDDVVAPVVRESTYEKRDEEKAVKLEEDKGDIFDQMLDKVSIKHKTKQTKTQKQKNSKKAKKPEEKPEDKKQ